MKLCERGTYSVKMLCNRVGGLDLRVVVDLSTEVNSLGHLFYFN